MSRRARVIGFMICIAACAGTTRLATAQPYAAANGYPAGYRAAGYGPAGHGAPTGYGAAASHRGAPVQATPAGFGRHRGYGGNAGYGTAVGQQPISGFDCAGGNCGTGNCATGCGGYGRGSHFGKTNWTGMEPIDWQRFAQGEYIGPHRDPHVPEYRLRVDDQIDFVYRITRDQMPTPYKLNIGDQIRVEVFADATLNRDLVILPDGTVVLLLVGEVHAAGHTAEQLRSKLEELYKKYYNAPNVAVTPLSVNTKLEDLRATVDARAGQGGQFFTTRVAPDGTVSLPAIGNLLVNGLTLQEIKREADERYGAVVYGMEVTPVLIQRAPRFLYVVGEVGNPGRFNIDSPTTLTQAIAMAGGWNQGANLNQVVVFRRGDDWRLLGTMLDIRGALYAKQPCPSDEIWLRDSDIVIVPKSPIQEFGDFVDLVFTRGLYGVLPGATTAVSFSTMGAL